ncbi:MAG: alpha/beta hydrolase [Legionellaceae bacterium]|nr:alpha/beta hydrolase [Legionellaceae bacterium]
MSTIERGSIRVKGFSNPEMDFQLIRQLGAASSRAASIGECLYIADAIQDHDHRQWVEAFARQALWQEEDGLERLRRNHLVSGREQLWKASLSFRAAEYYAPPGSEEQASLGLQSAGCFSSAMATTDFHFESHLIAFDHHRLPAYFISRHNDGQKRKTIMIISGFDGTLEEEFLMRGMAALERGYNVIHFAGPGQMDVFRHHSDTVFRPDYETVVRAVIDHFAFREEVDMDSLCLMGISFGGYFAIRAALAEPRIKSLIANSPILDLHAYLCAFTGMDPAQLPVEEDFNLEDLSAIPETEMSPQLKLQAAQLMVRFGGRSFRETFLHVRDYRVNEQLLSALMIPCLALYGSSEGHEPQQQARRFVELCPHASAFEFSSQQGASTHCQVGNISFANAVTYDWLDEQ